MYRSRLTSDRGLPLWFHLCGLPVWWRFSRQRPRWATPPQRRLGQTARPPRRTGNVRSRCTRAPWARQARCRTRHSGVPARTGGTVGRHVVERTRCSAKRQVRQLPATSHWEDDEFARALRHVAATAPAAVGTSRSHRCRLAWRVCARRRGDRRACRPRPGSPRGIPTRRSSESLRSVSASWISKPTISRTWTSLTTPITCAH